MKLLKHQRVSTVNKRKRKANVFIDTTDAKIATIQAKRRKATETLTELANDRANEAFDIILSHLNSRDIYNLSKANTACRERVQRAMFARK